MKMWIARDSNNALWFHNLKPQLERNPILNIDYWISRGSYYEVDQDLFPEVTFENSPQEVELKLIEKIMTRKELYSICHDEAVAYANSEQWSKRTGEEKSFLIQGYLDAMMEMRKSEITEMKKEYPKTYEECCKVLGVNPDNFLSIRNLYRDDGDEESTDYERDLLDKFGSLWELRICRDAYWKLYGEEMGLGEPWEPDWMNNLQHKHYISTECDEIKINFNSTTNKVLAFPTPEMRDAFKENFDPDIEICKELL